MEKIVGRDSHCDYIIMDPQKRVSRNHLSIKKEDTGYVLRDLNSSNGTFINGTKIPANTAIRIKGNEKVTLSVDFVLDIMDIFKNADPKDLDKTQILVQPNQIVQIQQGNKKITFDAEKTSIGELLAIDSTLFVKVGRNIDNDVVLSNASISRYHCKLRQLSPITFEIIDLDSTNGTFVDDKKLIRNESTIFTSNAKIRLGSSFSLDLKQCLPNIQLVNIKSPGSSKPGQTNIPTEEEMNCFNELELVWKEYNGRSLSVQNMGNSYLMGGMAIGSIASLALGPIGAVIGIGSSLLGRYIGQQKSNEIRKDATYEDQFLQIYACPRCNESFQKKPWVTIRDCFKCKTKYR
jgi:pSer/pThr/pTyr-binding forkhead associated (FHA) protein